MKLNNIFIENYFEQTEDRYKITSSSTSARPSVATNACRR